MSLDLTARNLANLSRSLTRKPEGEPLRRLGRFELLELIGEGDGGLVFRARDGSLGRDVALKMLKTVHTFSPDRLERFQREVRNASRLRHPSVVTVFEAGQEQDVLYYTMDLVWGRPFNRIEGDLRRRIEVLEKVARAVAYAHGESVVHRDLKPENILVDEAGEPHLLDFGLSREGEATSELSRTGSLLGTPLYMAPEQAEGRTREVGARSDVYALGGLLYEVLQGRPPFDAPSVAEVLTRLLSEPPKSPSGPPELAAIALAALEKDPARRTPTAAAFADDLVRWLRGERVEARRRRSRRWILWTGAAVLAAAPAFLFFPARSEYGPWWPIFDGATLECLRPEVWTSWKVEGGAIVPLPDHKDAAQTKKEFTDAEIRVRFEVKDLRYFYFTIRCSPEGSYGVHWAGDAIMPLEGSLHELVFACRGPAVTATLDGRPVALDTQRPSGKGCLQFNVQGLGFRIRSIEYREPVQSPP